mmetsp:Transcript_52096/g.148494  ORF Transcript_52096/g.148494 Transcript_52096/m.148494 type:complete len:262 (+) Transcript_52096:2827-3612(+)
MWPAGSNFPGPARWPGCGACQWSGEPASSKSASAATSSLRPTAGWAAASCPTRGCQRCAPAPGRALRGSPHACAPASRFSAWRWPSRQRAWSARWRRCAPMASAQAPTFTRSCTGNLRRCLTWPILRRRSWRSSPAGSRAWPSCLAAGSCTPPSARGKTRASSSGWPTCQPWGSTTSALAPALGGCSSAQRAWSRTSRPVRPRPSCTRSGGWRSRLTSRGSRRGRRGPERLQSPLRSCCRNCRSCCSRSSADSRPRVRAAR